MTRHPAKVVNADGTPDVNILHNNRLVPCVSMKTARHRVGPSKVYGLMSGEKNSSVYCIPLGRVNAVVTVEAER
jgi:hypothetical protein